MAGGAGGGGGSDPVATANATKARLEKSSQAEQIITFAQVDKEDKSKALNAIRSDSTESLEANNKVNEAAVNATRSAFTTFQVG
jgi:hypothetical protein